MTPVPNNPITVGPYRCGEGADLLLVAGPCVLQRETSLEIAVALKETVDRLREEGDRINLVFKGSFDKANRTSVDSWRGLGMVEGCRLLAEIKEKTGLPVTTDIHETVQADYVAKVVDLLQIPAFLARQTDLLASAAKTGKPVHVKKGQFMAPGDMAFVVAKWRSGPLRRDAQRPAAERRGRPVRRKTGICRAARVRGRGRRYRRALSRNSLRPRAVAQRRPQYAPSRSGRAAP